MIKRTEQDIMKNWKGNIDTPLVSVCTITYNHENYIEEALDSFLMQETNFPFELVIDDDCSPDGTADIIKQYMKKYPNIMNVRLRKKNVGSMTNFIENMQRAKGNYIALCEGDDYWTDPLKLQKQVDFLEKNDEYVITYTSVEAFDENGIIIDYIGGATRDLDSIELQKAPPINTLTVCFKNLIEQFPPEFQCSKFGDLSLWSLLGAYGKGKFLEDIQPARYRNHEGGVFSKKSKKVRFEMTLQTDVSFLGYYTRIHNEELASYFKKKMIISWIHSENFSKIVNIIFKFKKNEFRYALLTQLKKINILKDMYFRNK